MKWTKADRQYLLDMRKDIDVDNLKLKEQIKQLLLHDKYIVHVLNNKELEKQDAEPDDYFGVNILPFYAIPDIQHNIQNYVCYETGFKDIPQWDKSQKYEQITFYILCHKDNIIDKDTSLARHDLLAGLIKRLVNNEPFLGGRFKCVSDLPSVIDNDYPARTLIFEQLTDSDLVKKVGGKMMYGNKTGVISNG